MAKKTRDRRKGKSTRKKRDTSSPRQAGNQQKNHAAMVFQRGNYLLLLLGIAIIVVGYVMMRTENEVDGFISLYVAPLIILGGYLEIIYAILWKPKKKDDALQPAGKEE